MTVRFVWAFVISAGVAIVAGMLSKTSAWVFYADDRRPSHAAMVGTLEIDLPEGAGLGTAVLVDHCGILTNFHAVFGPWYVTTLRPPSRAFPAVFTLTEATWPGGARPTARAIPVIWGDYRGPDRHLRVPQHDWAYLVLERCLGREFGHFVLREADLQNEGTHGFSALGYSTGSQMADPVCSVHADRTVTGAESWLHDCALESGDSGGPIIRRETLALVALGSSALGDPRCPGAHDRGAPLARLSSRCANVAVPITGEIIDRVRAAEIAVGVQRALIVLGYDAGPLGAIDEPRATAAIRQAERDMGWAVTGQPTHALWKILLLRIPIS